MASKRNRLGEAQVEVEEKVLVGKVAEHLPPNFLSWGTFLFSYLKNGFVHVTAKYDRGLVSQVRSPGCGGYCDP